jgi:hypothetical protein
LLRTEYFEIEYNDDANKKLNIKSEDFCVFADFGSIFEIFVVIFKFFKETASTNESLSSDKEQFIVFLSNGIRLRQFSGVLI